MTWAALYIVLSLPGIVLTGWLLKPAAAVARELSAYADDPVVVRFGAVDSTGFFG